MPQIEAPNWPMPIKAPELQRLQARAAENRWESPIREPLPSSQPPLMGLAGPPPAAAPPAPEPTAWESRVNGIPMAGEGTGRVPGVFQGGVPTPESEAFNLANMRRPSQPINAIDQLLSRRESRMTDPDMLAAQEAAWQRDQERKRNLYEGVRGFSESLGNFRPVSPGEILLGWKNEAPPYVAETARRELARQGDLISPSQRAMIRDSWGMDLPAEARWSQVSGVLPFVSSAIRGGASDAYRWAEYARKMQQGSRAMDLREQSMDLARDRLGLSRESFERLPSQIVTKVSSAVKARAKLNELEQNFAANADFHDNVGPIWARLQEIARYGGVNNPEFTRYSALLRDAVSEYLTLQTGAQRGMVEVWWITQALPKVTDSKATFQALMEDWKKRLDFEIDSIARTYGAAGWNTSWIPGVSNQTPGMGTSAPGTAASPAPSYGSYSGPTVRMVDPDTGAQQDVPEQNVPLAEQRGWRRL